MSETQEVKPGKNGGKKPKAEKPAGEKKEATSKAFPKDAAVTLLVDKNPKRPNSKSHTRFEAYSKSKTVGEFITNGGTYGDLAWDSARGFVSIAGYTPKMVEKKA